MNGSQQTPGGRVRGDARGAVFFAAPTTSRSEDLVSGATRRSGCKVRAAGNWPLSNFLELGALPTAVGSARLHARLVVREWGFAELSETVELLVSELSTNALQASRLLEQPAVIGLWLLSDHQRVIVSVWDGNPQPPLRKRVSEDDEGGRGLILIEALSTRWGWYPSRDVGGKCVWCEIQRQEV
jgi:anti-sigma regulatory factor (Ser/Thr protein kinase)